MDAVSNDVNDVKRVVTVKLPVRQSLFMEGYKRTHGLSKSEIIRRLIDNLIEDLIKEEENKKGKKRYDYRQYK